MEKYEYKFFAWGEGKSESSQLKTLLSKSVVSESSL